MKRFIDLLLLSKALFLQAGCLLSAPLPAVKSAHTRSLENWYPDEGAQALAVAAEFGDAAEVRRLMKEEGVNPDNHAAILLRFRHMLETNKLGEALFSQVNTELKLRGYEVQTETIEDATIIGASSSTKSR